MRSLSLPDGSQAWRDTAGALISVVSDLRIGAAIETAGPFNTGGHSGRVGQLFPLLYSYLIGLGIGRSGFKSSLCPLLA